MSVETRLSSMVKKAKAQLNATEKLLRLNQKTLGDAQALAEMYHQNVHANKRIISFCKHSRIRRLAALRAAGTCRN